MKYGSICSRGGVDHNKTHLIESVFAGSGEMAALMRAFDWSTTPLGPVEQWPQALRICVQIVLRLRLSDVYLLGSGLRDVALGLGRAGRP